MERKRIKLHEPHIDNFLKDTAMKTINTTKESTSVLEMKGICIEFFSAYEEQDIKRILDLCTADGVVYFEREKGKIINFRMSLERALNVEFRKIK